MVTETLRPNLVECPGRSPLEIAHDDADPDDVGEVVWIGVIGCQFLSAAIGDDLVARLAHTWRVLLRAIVPEPSLAFFYEVLERSLGNNVH